MDRMMDGWTGRQTDRAVWRIHSAQHVNERNSKSLAAKASSRENSITDTRPATQSLAHSHPLRQTQAQFTLTPRRAAQTRPSRRDAPPKPTSWRHKHISQRCDVFMKFLSMNLFFCDADAQERRIWLRTSATELREFISGLSVRTEVWASLSCLLFYFDSRQHFLLPDVKSRLQILCDQLHFVNKQLTVSGIEWAVVVWCWDSLDLRACFAVRTSSDHTSRHLWLCFCIKAR